MAKRGNWTITRREAKWARRQTNRRVRHLTRASLRKGQDASLPKAPRTEGWITW